MRAAEVVAARVLFWGGVASVALMALGIAGALWLGAGLPIVYSSVAQVATALGRWPVEPFAVVAAGILLLLVTPVLSVVGVLVVFLAEGDRRYAGISAVLLLALCASLLVVGAGR
ncbi:MAG: DUF1634 domain-containing protein [Candidatus Rokubacteria bacterium]|nr:DUF1634 domain-containing protein [Candidatus Rokubacteria bacterium]